MLANTVFFVTRDLNAQGLRHDWGTFLTREQAEGYADELRRGYAAADAVDGPQRGSVRPGGDVRVEERVDAEQYAYLTKQAST